MMHLKKAGSIFPRICFAAPLLRQTASLSPRLKVENMNEQNYSAGEMTSFPFSAVTTTTTTTTTKTTTTTTTKTTTTTETKTQR